jgi:hypothetical protein
MMFDRGWTVSVVLSVVLSGQITPTTAQHGAVLSTNEFMTFALTCLEEAGPTQPDRCWFAQGLFLGSIGGVISADKHLNGTIRKQSGCNDFASKPIRVLFYEFRSWMHGRPDADLASDAILQFVFDRYPCPIAP